MLEEKEPITGIVLPSSVAADSPQAYSATLDAVASCCTRHLSRGGYFSESEAETMLDQYRTAISAGTIEAGGSRDFLIFTADAQAREHGLIRADEIRRMQKVLRWSVAERMPFWGFGPLPGKSEPLFQSCPLLRFWCRQLACPAVTAGDPGIVHVASINPIAALVSAALIEREVATVSGGVSPFVFPVAVDFADWQLLLQCHLAL